MTSKKRTIVTESLYWKKMFSELRDDMKVLKNIRDCLIATKDPKDQDFLVWLFKVKDEMMRYKDDDPNYKDLVSPDELEKYTIEEEAQAISIYHDLIKIQKEIIELYPSHPVSLHLSKAMKSFEKGCPDDVKDFFERPNTK